MYLTAAMQRLHPRVVSRESTTILTEEHDVHGECHSEPTRMSGERFARTLGRPCCSSPVPCETLALGNLKTRSVEQCSALHFRSLSGAVARPALLRAVSAVHLLFAAQRKSLLVLLCCDAVPQHVSAPVGLLPRVQLGGAPR